MIDVTTRSRLVLLRDLEGHLGRPHASGDDRWVAFRRFAPDGTAATYIAPVAPGRPPALETWQRVDDSITGRPCGWSPDARTAYLLLDTDGFRCLWGQRLDGRTGRTSSPVFPVRHFHMQMDDGPSTSFGNAVSRAGFLYERTHRTGNIWRFAGRNPEAR